MSCYALFLSKGALASLQTLSLANNLIGDDGLKAFAEACRAKGALASCQKLILKSNQVGDVGLSALAEACANGALSKCTYIGINGNPASKEAQQAVKDALQAVKDALE